MADNPYADSASDYLAGGWSPFPLPYKKKDPPPVGVTGYAGADVTAEMVAKFKKAGRRNIGLRPPEHVIGIDVDNYGGKTGGATLTEVETRLGPLPPTWRSTSRDDDLVSGIRFFRVPGGRQWADEVGPDVEIVHRGHRYAVAHPSLHPEAGRVYGWWDPDGFPADCLPAVTEFPDLPDAWVQELDRGDLSERVAKADLKESEAWQWLERLPDGDPCPAVLRALDSAADRFGSRGSRHNVARDISRRIIGFGEAGHAGVVIGLQRLEEAFSDAVGGDRSTDTEWVRMVTGGVALAVATPTPEDQRGCCDPEDSFEPLAEVAVAEAGEVAATGHAFRIAEAYHPGSPMPNARLLLRRCPPMRWWRSGWYVYRDGVYVPVSDGWVRTVIYHAFEDANYVTGRGTENEATHPWDPSPASVNATLDALGAVSMVPDEQEPDTSRINLANGFLDVDTGVLIPHSEQVFSVVQLPFAYDEKATCPEWMETLADVFEDDPDAVLLAQEMFGYIVSGRTDLQKMFYLLGPRRGFKGTMIRVLTALVGPANVASPTVASYAKDFGLAGLIGKTLATTADARFGRTTDIQTVTERWLTISGEDSISVPRKHRDDWVGTLGARIIIASNEAPPFRDASAAVVSRLVLLRFTKSYLGREDTGLTDRLLGELPGILNWALDGLDRLNERGRFTEPRSSLSLARELEEEASPLAAFVQEKCVTGPDQKVLCSEFIGRLDWWLAERGEGMTSRAVGLALRSAYPKVERKKRGRMGSQEWHYVGIGWR